MIGTLDAGKSYFMCFTAFIEEFCNGLNANINYIDRQISVNSMELLRIFNVKIVNMHKIHMFAHYKLDKAVLYEFPGNFNNIIINSYGLFMGRLARG